jgi:hypothetical protein
MEIGAVLGRAVEQGHPLGFVTLTMRHDRSQSLADLWAAASKGWQRAISGKGWVAAGSVVEGFVRVWEVTHGRNGWHVHVHLVLVLAVGSTAADLENVAGGMFSRWSSGLTASGLAAPRRVGQEWHIVTGADAPEELGGYLAKMANPESTAGLGLELTHGLAGRSAAGLRTRPVWGLLDDLVATGETVALRRWHEWERVSKGKRQVGWSRGLRQRFAPDVEDVTDEEVVAAEVGTAADDVLHLTADSWRALVAVPVRIVALLEAVEDGGVEAAGALLDRLGIGWSAR